MMNSIYTAARKRAQSFSFSERRVQQMNVEAVTRQNFEAAMTDLFKPVDKKIKDGSLLNVLSACVGEFDKVKWKGNA